MKGETTVSPFLWRARQGGKDGMNDKSPAENLSFPHCAIVVEGPLIARFFLLLQQGVKIRRRVGCTVAAFLQEQAPRP